MSTTSKSIVDSTSSQYISENNILLIILRSALKLYRWVSISYFTPICHNHILTFEVVNEIWLNSSWVQTIWGALLVNDDDRIDVKLLIDDMRNELKSLYIIMIYILLFNKVQLLIIQRSNIKFMKLVGLIIWNRSWCGL